MDSEKKEELLYILESRLSRYVDIASEWFRTTAKSISGTYTDRISGEVPLYFRSNRKPWQSLVPYVTPFCFVFTKDLCISNMIDSNMRVEDLVSQAAEEGLSIRGMRIEAKSNTHLMGTSRQVLLIYPEDLSRAVDKGPVHLTLTVDEATALLDNNTIDRKTRAKISRQLQGDGLPLNSFN